MKTTLAAFLFVLVSACGTSDLPAGAVCEATADCEGGLSCLDIAQINGTTCTVVGKTCSTTCANDAACAPLGANFRCFATCTTEKVCGEVASP
jgi:hypothetical protein